jgi:hypothetical protein
VAISRVEKKKFLMNFLENKSNKKTAVRLANEIQSDDKIKKTRTHEDSIKFLDAWLNSIDETWFDQCYDSIASIGTFWDFSQRGKPV